MTERTFRIIMACKQWCDGDVIDNAKLYILRENLCAPSALCQESVATIMEAAMLDYIDTCDKPSTFLKEFWWQGKSGEYRLSFAEQVARAFRYTTVKDHNGNYINGFGEWMK